MSQRAGEWRRIESEPGDPPYLFSNYVAIRAAVPAVCGFIGMSIVGLHGGRYRIGIVDGLAAAIVRYVLTFVMVYVIAIVTDALAPTFGGTKNWCNALKLVVYAITSIWLAGVFLLIPRRRILGSSRSTALSVLAQHSRADEGARRRVGALRHRGRAVRDFGFARHRDDRRLDHPGLTTRRLEVNIARR